jgi:hypothetical protein
LRPVVFRPGNGHGPPEMTTKGLFNGLGYLPLTLARCHTSQQVYLNPVPGLLIKALKEHSGISGHNLAHHV